MSASGQRGYAAGFGNEFASETIDGVLRERALRLKRLRGDYDSCWSGVEKTFAPGQR